MKVYQKVKFVAGDETGVVVCYTNYIPDVKVNNYVILHECSLQRYKNLSYEIAIDKCKSGDLP